MYEITLILQIITCMAIIIMYLYIGYKPKTHWTEKLVFNVITAITGTALNIIAGFYYLIPMQFVAVWMGVKQWRAFKDEHRNL